MRRRSVTAAPRPGCSAPRASRRRRPDRPRDVGGRVGAQEQDGLGDVPGVAGPAERDRAYERLPQLRCRPVVVAVAPVADVDVAGRDDVRRDPVRPELHREDAPERLERSLRGGVCGPRRPRAAGGAGGDADDAAAAPGVDAAAGEGPAEHERPGHVHVEHTPPLVRRHVEDGRVRVGGGVVHEDVELPEPGHRLGDGALGRGPGRRRRHEERRGAARPCRRAGRPCRCRGRWRRPRGTPGRPPGRCRWRRP